MKGISIRESRNFFSGLPVILLLAVFLCYGSGLRAQGKTATWYADPASSPPDLPVSIRHLTARVSFKPEQNLVIGQAEFRVTPNRSRIDSIVFLTPDFVISKVTLDGNPVKYRQSGNQLIIFPSSRTPRPSSLIPHPVSGIQHPVSSIVIAYTATPPAGPIYFVGWRPEESGKRKQVWAHRPMGWLPYMDGRITVDMYVTFDAKYSVFSNGERMEILSNPDGTKTWHYAMKKDHPFFSTALVIGEYTYQPARTERGLPLEYWYYSDMADRVATTYKYTPEMFAFFEKELGVNYPYPVYREAPVIDYMYGAMETTTSTIFGDYMQISPRAWWQRNYVNVNAHELAHQWFGNYVAHFVNRDVWLTESFGTYYAKLFEKHIFGDDYYQNIRNDEMNLAFEAARKNSFPVGGTQGGTQRIYQKGSLVLDMLRDVMGDYEFRSAVKSYLEKYGFGYAETGDFIRCCYDACGKPMNWFFDEWILRGGEPEYVVRDVQGRDSLGRQQTVFHVWQVQEINELNGLFRMPVRVEVHYTDGSCDSITPWIDKAFTTIAVLNPAGKEVSYTLFDPGRRILKKMNYPRSFERLAAQAAYASGMIDRYDAWIALRGEPVEKKKELLLARYRMETFWLIRSEILDQLAADRSPETVETFREALKDKDALVRRAALRDLDPVPDLLRSTMEGNLYDSSYANVELALGNLCRSFPAGTGHYLELTRDMEGWRGRNIRMKWLEIAIGSGKKEFLPELAGYSGPTWEFETRMNAFAVMKRLGYSDPGVIKNAEEARKHWNNKLATAAKEYLGK